MVYLDHLDRPYPRDDRASCQHYAGFVTTYSRGATGRVLSRQYHHAAGRGSRFLAAVSSSGIGWRVVRVWWDGTRELERAIKSRRSLAHFCPTCNPKMRRYATRADYWTIEPVLGVFTPRVLTNPLLSSTVQI